MGAWIETDKVDPALLEYQVAPFMGAWIETTVLYICSFLLVRRTLHGCVD